MRAARYVVLALKDTELPSGPLVLLDAIARGKPTILTNVGGSRDYVADGESALVMEPGDVAGLDEAMRRLDTDELLRRPLAEGSLRAAALRPDAFWDAVLGAWPESAGS
jgi:glycosyltransferase involved in cell wall biosynthesis